MKKRIFSILMAVVMVVALMPSMALAEETDPGVTVCGENMAAGNYLIKGETGYIKPDTIPADNYAYYNDGKLTLKNFSYEGDIANPIYRVGDLEILLIGANSLKVTSEGTSCGINVDGNLTVSEYDSSGGSLSINGAEIGICITKDVTINDGSFIIDECDKGIKSAEGNVTIKNGDITIDSKVDGIYVYGYGNAEIGQINIINGNVDITSETNGIYADHAIVIIDGGNICIDAQESGIFGYSYHAAKDDITINNGIVNVTAGKYGLSADFGNLAINGGSVVARSLFEGIEGETADSDFYAIYIQNDLNEHGVFKVKGGLDVKASTEPYGTLGEYDSEKHVDYDMIKVGTTVTYTDGVDGVEIFKDKIYVVGIGDPTPKIETPSRGGYSFTGWTPEVAETVTGDAVYAATWKKKSSNPPSSGSITPTEPTYPPVVEDTENGDVDVSTDDPKKDEEVTVTPKPDEGFEVGDVVIKDNEGNEIEVTDNGDGSFSYVQPEGEVTIEVSYNCDGGETCPHHDFADLAPKAWYHNAVDFVLNKGMMNGVGEEMFAPNGTTSRSMIVTILWRLEGSPQAGSDTSFSDVPADQWYSEAVKWAASNGIVEGYDGVFNSDGNITREQLATIMWRYSQYKGYDTSVGEDTNILSYGDATDVSDWAVEAMAWACGAGVIEGIENGDTMNLDPNGNATRAQVATILYRYCTMLDLV